MKQFDAFLQELVFTKISRNDLMTKLQLKYEIFGSLDAITLSRWSNGVTSPSLEKQLIIAKEQNLTDEFLTEYSSCKASVKLNRLFSDYWNSMDTSFHSIMHHDDNKRLKFKQHFYSDSVDEYPMYSKLKKAFNANSEKQERDLLLQRFSLLSENSNKVISHTSLFTDLDSSIKNMEVSNSVVRAVEHVIKQNDHIAMGLSIYASSDDHRILLGIVGNHLLEHYFDKKRLLTIVRRKEMLNILEASGAIQVCCLKFSPEFDNLYLYQIPLTEFLGNPVIFRLTCEQRQTYKNLMLSDR